MGRRGSPSGRWMLQITQPLQIEAQKASLESAAEVAPWAGEPNWSVPETDSALFCPEGRWASAGGCDGFIFVWHVDHPGAVPPCVRCCVAHFDVCTDHVVDWERMKCLSVGGDFNLAMLDLMGGVVRSRIKSDAGPDCSLLCVDGDLSAGKAAVGAGAQAKIADIETKTWLMTLQGHQDDVHGIRSDWDTNQVVTSSWDRLLKLWDLRSGRCVRSLEGHNQVCTKFDVDFSLQLALSCSDEDRLILWDLKQGGVIKTYDGGLATANDASVDWKTMTAAVCGPGGEVQLWDLETGEITSTITTGAATTGASGQSVDVDWERRQLLLGTWDSQVLLFDLDSGECVKKLRKPRRTLTRVHLKK